MPTKIAYISPPGFIEVTLAGELSLAEVSEVVVTSLALAKEKSCGRFWLNAQQLTGYGPLVEVYQVGQLYEQLQIDRHYREAILLPLDPEAAAGLRFFETVAVNRGFQVKVFETHEQARILQWLLG